MSDEVVVNTGESAPTSAATRRRSNVGRSGPRASVACVSCRQKKTKVCPSCVWRRLPVTGTNLHLLSVMHKTQSRVRGALHAEHLISSACSSKTMIGESELPAEDLNHSQLTLHQSRYGSRQHIASLQKRIHSVEALIRYVLKLQTHINVFYTDWYGF